MKTRNFYHAVFPLDKKLKKGTRLLDGDYTFFNDGTKLFSNGYKFKAKVGDVGYRFTYYRPYSPKIQKCKYPSSPRIQTELFSEKYWQYKCSGCDTTPCVVFMIAGLNPSSCLIVSEFTKQNWKRV